MKERQCLNDIPVIYRNNQRRAWQEKIDQLEDISSNAEREKGSIE